MRFMLNAGCSADLRNAREQTSKMGHFSFSTSLSLTCVMRWTLRHPQFLHAISWYWHNCLPVYMLMPIWWPRVTQHLGEALPPSWCGHCQNNACEPLQPSEGQSRMRWRVCSLSLVDCSRQFGTGLQPIWSTHKQWVELSHKARLNI